MKSWLWLATMLAATSAVAMPEAGEPEAQFNDESYKLGYNVYLQRGNLAAAFLLAAKAIRTQSNNPEWLKRYAQSAEWVGKPSIALDGWLILARKTNSKEAWESVARLAPSLLNDEALLAYQQNILRGQPDNDQVIGKITQTYERLGQVSQGLMFLAELEKQHPSQSLLEAEADLAERGGEPERAIALLTALINRYGVQETWVIRRSGVHYTRGELDIAWAELQALEAKMPATASGFWQTYGELSRILNHQDNAVRAYRVLVDNNEARPIDLRNYIDALQNKDGKAAAHLSAMLFSQSHKERDLITALYLYQRENNLAAAEKLLASLTSEQQKQVQQLPDFLEQRGYIYWKRKKYQLARADFERALHLAPSNLRLLPSLIGVVIDQNDTEALRATLSALNATAQVHPELWSLWASGWNFLNQPQKALPFLKAYSSAHADNDLALLGLADAYAGINDVRTAELLRKRVLARQHDTSASPEATQKQALLIQDALLAMALNEAQPEASLAALHDRLKQDNWVFDQRNRELVLIWLLAHESEEQASSWVTRAYRGDAPVWAKTSIAVQQHDYTALHDTLNTSPQSLPRYMRVQIASEAGQFADAESMAFASVDTYPDDDEQHRIYSTLMSQRSSWVSVAGDSTRESILKRHGLAAAWSGQVNPHWRLQLGAHHHRQSSRDSSRLRPPADDSRLSLQLTRSLPSTTYGFGLNHIDALSSVLGANIRQDITFDRDLHLGWRADYHAEATDSIALLTMGMKDQLMTNANWTITSKNYLAGELSVANFYGQTSQSLGDGQMMLLEFGHHLSLDVPQHSVKIITVITRFNADEQALEPELQAVIPASQDPSSLFFMPTGYRQIGLYWSVGEPAPSVYSPAWDYFGELGANYTNTTGKGYALRLGLHGPVLGSDRLTLSVESTKGGKNEGDQTRAAMLNYRYFY
jgi:hypothetical protein